MAKITVHAGDFKNGDAPLHFGYLTLKTSADPWRGEQIGIHRLQDVQIATEESVKKLGGTVGWGAAGAILLGPVGLLAGLLLGGRKKEITFVARLDDGRKLLATTDADTFRKLQAAAFNNVSQQPFSETPEDENPGRSVWPPLR